MTAQTAFDVAWFDHQAPLGRPLVDAWCYQRSRALVGRRRLEELTRNARPRSVWRSRPGQRAAASRLRARSTARAAVVGVVASSRTPCAASASAIAPARLVDDGRRPGRPGPPGHSPAAPGSTTGQSASSGRRTQPHRRLLRRAEVAEPAAQLQRPGRAAARRRGGLAGTPAPAPPSNPARAPRAALVQPELDTRRPARRRRPSAKLARRWRSKRPAASAFRCSALVATKLGARRRGGPAASSPRASPRADAGARRLRRRSSPERASPCRAEPSPRTAAPSAGSASQRVQLGRVVGLQEGDLPVHRHPLELARPFGQRVAHVLRQRRRRSPSPVSCSISASRAPPCKRRARGPRA